MSRKGLKITVAGTLAALALALAATAALASRPLEMLTGTLTAPSSQTRIEIDHKVYYLLPGGGAAALAAKVTTGMLVDAFFDGPPADSASRVVGVNRHQGN